MLRLFKEGNEVRAIGDQFGSPTDDPTLQRRFIELFVWTRMPMEFSILSAKAGSVGMILSSEIFRMAQENRLLTKEAILRRSSIEDYPTKTPRPRNSCLSKHKIIKSLNITPSNWGDTLNEFRLKST